MDASIQTSINYAEQKHQNALEVLLFISLFPSGITEDELVELREEKEETLLILSTLKIMSLITICKQKG